MNLALVILDTAKNEVKRYMRVRTGAVILTHHGLMPENPASPSKSIQNFLKNPPEETRA